MDLLIIHGYVVTMDPERRIYADGAVAIEGNRIKEVGPTAEIQARYRARQIIDAGGMLVVPGLIDGHNHTCQYLSKGIGDDVHIMTWAYERVYPYEAHLTPEDVYIGAQGDFVEMLRSGTTCFNDPGGYHMDAVGEAARDVGIRGIFTRSTRDRSAPGGVLPETLYEDLETNLRESEALIRKWNGAADGRLRAWCSLRYVFNVSDELCREIKSLADRYGVGIHAHASGMKDENDIIESQFGKRSLERLYDLGLFAPNLYLIHMGFPDEREIQWLREHDVKVVHCPSASMHGAYGVIGNRMIPEMMRAGITMALGTDSATAGRFLDMVRVMYLAACAHKDAYADPRMVGAYKALEMATIEGARACLWDDEIGSLEAGKRADLLLVDMSGSEWHPSRDVVRNFIYSANGYSVDTVIVDGRLLMRHRVLLTIDEERVKYEVDRTATALMERAGISMRPPWPVL